MKKYLTFIIVAFCTTFSACDNYDTNYPEGYAGSSKITTYAEIQTNGDRLVILNQGGAYTEQGATATYNGESYDYTTTGSVNTAVPGLYGITYTAVNPDGFPATDFRTIVVISPNVAANDFSGNYKRNATGQVSKWTKTAPGVYTLVNPGGAAAGTELVVTVVNYEGNKIRIPYQYDSEGTLSTSKNETYTPGVKYTWVFLNPGYGTGLREFIKQ